MVLTDNCEVCGATYSSTELNNAKSAISGATPITKDSEHYFFDLPQFLVKVFVKVNGLFVAQLLKTCHITNRRIQPNIEVFTLYTWYLKAKIRK
jgi:hypothetical protein